MKYSFKLLKNLLHCSSFLPLVKKKKSIAGNWHTAAISYLSCSPFGPTTNKKCELISLTLQLSSFFTLHLPRWGYFESFQVLQLTWIESWEIIATVGVGVSGTMQSSLQALSSNGAFLVAHRFRMRGFSPVLIALQLQWVRTVIGPTFVKLCWAIIPTYILIHQPNHFLILVSVSLKRGGGWKKTTF